MCMNIECYAWDNSARMRDMDAGGEWKRKRTDKVTSESCEKWAKNELPWARSKKGKESGQELFCKKCFLHDFVQGKAWGSNRSIEKKKNANDWRVSALQTGAQDQETWKQNFQNIVIMETINEEWERKSLICGDQHHGPAFGQTYK